MGFYYFSLGYLEKGAPYFVDVTDKLELVIEEDEDNGQPIIDYEDKKVRKVLERTAKRKTQRNNLCALVWKALAAGSAASLLPRSPVFVLSSCPGSPTLLPSHPLELALLFRLPMPALSFCPFVSALSSFFVPALSSSPLPASPSCSVLGQTSTCFTSSAYRIFKQALSDEPWGHRSTSPSLA